MNKVVLCGRLCADPAVRYTQDNKAVARYRLAVDRRKPDEADFINCVEFGKLAEFAEKYYRKGTKILVSGRIQTGSYDDRDGKRVYTTEVVVEDHEFAESKNNQARSQPESGGFEHVPDELEEGLPFN